MKHIADFETTINGIPCGVVVTQAQWDHADDGRWFESDWFLVDRKGYKANWLEQKITDADERRIYREIKRVYS